MPRTRLRHSRTAWIPIALILSVGSVASFASGDIGGSEQVPAVASAVLPATPAGRQFSDWLKAFNSQSLEEYGAFISARSPALAKFIKDDHGFAVATGGFAVVRVDQGDEHNLTGLLTEPFSDQLTRFAIKVDP